MGRTNPLPPVRCAKPHRTLFLWTCPRLTTLDDLAIRRSQHLVPWAERDFSDCTIFWGRGITPAFPAKVDDAPFFHAFRYGVFTHDMLPHNCIYSTDASGGICTSDIRLQRCGFGATQYIITPNLGLVTLELHRRPFLQSIGAQGRVGGHHGGAPKLHCLRPRCG